VVIAIIGLLSSVIVTALSSARLSARDARRVTDIQQIKSGMDLFFTSGNGYPPKAEFDAAIATQDVLTCGSVPIIRPVQDPFYPQPGWLYNYTNVGSVTSGCGGTNNLNTDYQITFVLESTGTTYTMDSGGQFSPSIPEI